jgi:hypothetical protein
MIIKPVIILISLFSILSFAFPLASAIGDFSISIDEAYTEDGLSENQTSLTIFLYGMVDYTGYSISGDTIFLSSFSDIGETYISPQEVTFHSTGIEEFTVEFTIQNDYENGTIVNISVSGIYQQGGTTVAKSADAQIHLRNHSYPDDGDDPDSSKIHEKDEALIGSSAFLIISSSLIITTITIIIYKKIHR